MQRTYNFFFMTDGIHFFFFVPLIRVLFSFLPRPGLMPKFKKHPSGPGFGLVIFDVDRHHVSPLDHPTPKVPMIFFFLILLPAKSDIRVGLFYSYNQTYYSRLRPRVGTLSYIPWDHHKRRVNPPRPDSYWRK